MDEAIAAWWTSPIECLSALARLRREDALTSDEEGQAQIILRALMAAWTEVEPSEAVREQAARVLRLHPLRAADSLQLAAALVWCQGDPSQREFICLDQRLREAARREGFVVSPRL
jgi:predicted nucleic acid-binding protein